MAPRRAAEIFQRRNIDCTRFRVTLYGSLALTGKGHLTDVAILDTLKPHGEVELVWESTVFLPFHPNGMRFQALDDNDNITDDWTVYSVGGGALAEEDSVPIENADVYPHKKLTDILMWCRDNGRTFWEYVELHEGKEIWIFLAKVWRTMREAVERGIETDGVIPGPLNLARRAMRYNVRASGYKQSLQSRGLIFSYALAVSEENACGGRIVTAPTCGSSGVIPAVLYHLWKTREFSEARILRALATAGLIGNIVKHNASISGAEVGCQGEVGVACAMAAAAANQLFGGTPAQIEYAAEMGLEHHLGMTCDPICGLVQIPCIERNAIAAMRALNAVNLADFLADSRMISFDMIVETMYETGKDLKVIYRETAEGGMAKQFRK